MNDQTFFILLGFHSISFPSEWGGMIVSKTLTTTTASFHSISFPSEWGDDRHGSTYHFEVDPSFHSISFPSEWGVRKQILGYDYTDYSQVSIQLVSPASGEWSGEWKIRLVVGTSVSIQLVSPASGEPLNASDSGRKAWVSIQLVSPASGEYPGRGFDFSGQGLRFHSISFPSEWGEPQSQFSP